MAWDLRVRGVWGNGFRGRFRKLQRESDRFCMFV